ncbi:hypothetical protein GQ53DRAFT_548494 [Thozetella sp. PMI_491]|nr:hypothetical protein GQ53DRAFT_548494 [Thozetella sp. PMI_491]
MKGWREVLETKHRSWLRRCGQEPCWGAPAETQHVSGPPLGRASALSMLGGWRGVERPPNLGLPCVRNSLGWFRLKEPPHSRIIACRPVHVSAAARCPAAANSPWLLALSSHSRGEGRSARLRRKVGSDVWLVAWSLAVLVPSLVVLHERACVKAPTFLGALGDTIPLLTCTTAFAFHRPQPLPSSTPLCSVLTTTPVKNSLPNTARYLLGPRPFVLAGPISIASGNSLSRTSPCRGCTRCPMTRYG